MKTVSSKVSDDEHKAILEYANECGFTISELIKRALMNRVLFVGGGYDSEAPQYEVTIPDNLDDEQAFLNFVNKFRKMFGLRLL